MDSNKLLSVKSYIIKLPIESLLKELVCDIFMNSPFSLIPANTSLKLHIIRKKPSVDKIIVAHSIPHITYNKRKNMTVASSAFCCSSELTLEKTVVIVVL